MNVSLRALRRTSYVSLLLIVAVQWAATSVSAGTIKSSAPAPAASGTGLGTVLVPPFFTLNPNNDNSPDPNTDDNNIFVPIKRFDNVGYIDIEFAVDPSGGTTEYRLFESVDNNTGIDWDRYEMTLGFGTGAGFMLSAPLDGLDFDDPDFDTPPMSSIMLSVSSPNEDTLVFSNGTHGTGAQSYVVRIDVPDMGLTPAEPYKFTLRQVPIATTDGGVPEPATFVLLGLALAGFAGFRSRG